jgi:hypothetical protein
MITQYGNARIKDYTVYVDAAACLKFILAYYTLQLSVSS